MTAKPLLSPAEWLLAMLEGEDLVAQGAPPQAMPEDRPPHGKEQLPLGDVVARPRELGVDPAVPNRFRELVGGRGRGRGPTRPGAAALGGGARRPGPAKR